MKIVKINIVDIFFVFLFNIVIFKFDFLQCMNVV